MSFDYKFGIIYGDIGIFNMLFVDKLLVLINVLVDWELLIIGDLMVDMGWFCNGMCDECILDIIFDFVYDICYWFICQELVCYYVVGIGCSIDNFDYYLIFLCFKVGCIMEYKVVQVVIGKFDKKVGEWFGDIVLDCFVSLLDYIKKFC